LVLLLLICAPGFPVEVQAGGSIAGVCPDGSAFVVRQKADIPCDRARLVEPSAVPPLRPELLPRPYPWMVDQEARNPNNPYNLLDAAEAVRALHSGESKEEATKGSSEAGSGPVERARRPTSSRSGPALASDEIEALVELVDLRQDVAPATLRAEDAIGRGRMEVRFAYSNALESTVLRWLGRGHTQARVVIFSVRALEAGEFYPSLFFLQDAEGFRPDPERTEEVGFLIGSAGSLDPGAIRLGYVILPGRFSPVRPIELWWNDRRIEAVLSPEG
jgi:hypothetical protein